MNLSRARFMRISSALVFSTVLSPIPIPATPYFSSTRKFDVKDLSLDIFSPHVDSIFRLHRPKAQPLNLELVEANEKVNRYASMPGVPQLETFSLLFRGPVGEYIDQETYTFSHPEIGEFSIFITPVIGPDQEGYYYQALFNRIVSQPNVQPEKKEIL